MKRRRAWIDYLQYAAVRLGTMAIGAMPIETSRSMMRAMGWVWFHAPAALAGAWWVIPPLRKAMRRLHDHRLRAEAHIRLSFPEFDERHVSRLALESMQHLAALFGAELPMTPRLIRPDTWA